MNETVRLRQQLNDALESKEEENIKYEEFSSLEEKYYMQSNIIESLKTDNDKLSAKLKDLQANNFGS